jgi:hypothetical protein
VGTVGELCTALYYDLDEPRALLPPRPSELVAGGSIMVFLAGVPATYDQKEGAPPNPNRRGGRWTLLFNKPGGRGPPPHYTPDRVNEIWLEVVLGLGGGTIDFRGAADEEGVATGAYLMHSPDYFRISVWTREATPERNPRILALGHQLLGVMGVPELFFEDHHPAPGGPRHRHHLRA